MKKKVILLLLCFFAFSIWGLKIKPFKIAVFVPGVIKGNPTYEMLVDGVSDAVKKAEQKEGLKKGFIEIKIVEGGFNQGEWKNGLMALALQRRYDLIVSSNPSLPKIVEEVLKVAPKQKFLLLDSNLAGNKNIKTIAFNQYEQGYINGYFSAMMSLHKNKKSRKIGLLAGQEFPIMNNEIKKGFIDGAKAVDKNFELDFRVLGNWFDAVKAANLAKMMIKNDCNVILTICGGGNAGVVSAARELDCFVSWFDSSGYSYGKNIVIGSSVVRLKSVCSEAVLNALYGKLNYGEPTVLGIKEGSVDFEFEGLPKNVPNNIIEKQKKLIQQIKINGIK